MSVNPKVAFFDGIAERWDGWEDLELLATRLDAGLATLGVEPGESVVDVGCGTGNLTLALLRRLSPAGRVLAVDLAPAMIAVARRKVSDPRVTWHVGDALRLPLADGAADRVLCCSVWPHFDDPAATAAELRRALRPGGTLDVWHPLPRARVNAIHADAGEAVRRDVLPPAEETARLLAGLGFRVARTIDDATQYLVSAARSAE